MNLEVEAKWPNDSSGSFSLLKSINAITKISLSGRRLSPDSRGQIVCFTEENEPIQQATILHCQRDIKGLLNHIEKRDFKSKTDTNILSLAEAKQLLKAVKNETE